MPDAIVVKCLKLRPEIDGDIPLPRYMTAHSAGMDICAAVERDVTIGPGDIFLAPTGLSIALPEGVEAQIRPRSGLAVNHGMGIVNSPGTIDADYRGEIKIALINYSKTPFTLHRGDRIAQMVVSRVCTVLLEPAVELEASPRQGGGFGHTGLSSS